MQVVLVMFRGEGERRSFSIVRDVTVIGRREDCDFRIPLGEISRKHCRLIKDGEALRAEDLGSSNGTYVNGLRVQEADLSPGDTLKVGSVVFVVQIDGVPSEEDLHPSAPTASDSASAMAAPPEEHELLNPTNQVDAAHAGHDADMAVEAGDEPVDEPVNELAEEQIDEHAQEHAEQHAANNGAADDEMSFVASGDHPTLNEQLPEEHSPSDDPSEHYDPMSVLAADPDASSVGSMLDDDRIAEDLIIELESHDRGQASNPA